MAKSGRRPPDLRDTLGSFVQSALEQVSVVREVVERGAQAQRSRYDSVKVERQRKDALAALGEAVYRQAVRGSLGELSDDPDIRAQLEEIDNLDQRIEQSGQRGTSSAGFRSNAGWPKQRKRARAADREPMRVWRPVPPFAAPDAPHDEGDSLDDDLEPVPPPAPPRGGGIRFGDDWDDDDDDLEEYMHEDDVPEAAAAKPAPAPAPKPKSKAKPRKRRAPKKKKAE